MESKERWCERESVRLGTAVAKYGSDWELVAAYVGSRSADECRDKYGELEAGLVPGANLFLPSASSLSLSSLPSSSPSLSSSSSSLPTCVSAEQQSAAQAQATAMLSRRRSSDTDSSRRAYSLESYMSGESMSSGATLDASLSVDELAALPRLDSLAMLRSASPQSASLLSATLQSSAPRPPAQTGTHKYTLPQHLQLLPKQEQPEQAQPPVRKLATQLRKQHKQHVAWTADELERLHAGIRLYGRDWRAVALHVGTRKNDDCMFKVKAEVARGRMREPDGKRQQQPQWSDTELALLQEAVNLHGCDWTAVARHVGGGRLPGHCQSKARNEFKRGHFQYHSPAETPHRAGMCRGGRPRHLAQDHDSELEEVDEIDEEEEEDEGEDVQEESQSEQEIEAHRGVDLGLTSSLDNLATAASRLVGSSAIKKKRACAASRSSNIRKERSGSCSSAQSGDDASRVPSEPSTAAGSPLASPRLEPMRGNLLGTASSSSSSSSSSTNADTSTEVGTPRRGTSIDKNPRSNAGGTRSSGSNDATLNDLANTSSSSSSSSSGRRRSSGPHKKRKHNKWTADEVSRLLEGVQRFGRDWVEVAKHVGSRTNYDCLFKVKGEVSAGRMQEPAKGGRGTKLTPWTKSEVSILALAVQQFGRNWPVVSRVVGSRSPELCLSKVKNEVRVGRMPKPRPSEEPAQWSDAQCELLRRALPRFEGNWGGLEQLLGGSFSEAEIRLKIAELAEEDLAKGDGASESASASGAGDDDDDNHNNDAFGDGEELEASKLA
jgi:hypothetical protein